MRKGWGVLQARRAEGMWVRVLGMVKGMGRRGGGGVRGCR